MESNYSELTIIEEGGRERTVPLVKQFILGSRPDADLVLEEHGVAPSHLVINPSRKGAMLIVLDQEHALPVLVANAAIEGAHRLLSGDIVRVGATQLVYRAGVYEATPHGLKNPFWGADQDDPTTPTRSRTLDSQAFSWFTAESPQDNDRVVQALYRLTSLSCSASSENALLEGSLELVMEVTGSQRGLIVGSRGAEVVPLAARGFAPGVSESSLPFELAYLRSTLAQRLSTTTLMADGPTAYAPIVASGAQPEAVLCLKRLMGQTGFSNSELELMASVGRQVGTALVRVRVLKQLQSKQLLLTRLQRRFEAALTAIPERLVLISSSGELEPLGPHSKKLLELVCGQRIAWGQPLPPTSPLASLVSETLTCGASSVRDVDTGALIIRVSVSSVASLTAAVIVLRDVTEERRREEAHQQAERALQERILQTGAQERRRIGRDLHDGLCQQLVGISLLAQGLTERLSSQAGMITIRERVGEIATLLSKAADDGRRLAKGLCPVELEAGLGYALQELATTTQQVFPEVTCTVSHTGQELPANHPTATHLYRIAQEAVTNAIKHASPRRVDISLVHDSCEVRLEVRNDGPPMQAQTSDGMGLSIMAYRARVIGAQLSLDPTPSGTRLECRVPLRPSSP